MKALKSETQKPRAVAKASGRNSPEYRVAVNEGMSRLLEALAPKPGMQCLNCSSRPAVQGDVLCTPCTDTAIALTQALERGITLQYTDGTREELK